jgi:hypothetical protein
VPDEDRLLVARFAPRHRVTRLQLAAEGRDEVGTFASVEDGNLDALTDHREECAQGFVEGHRLIISELAARRYGLPMPRMDWDKVNRENLAARRATAEQRQAEKGRIDARKKTPRRSSSPPLSEEERYWGRRVVLQGRRFVLGPGGYDGISLWEEVQHPDGTWRLEKEWALSYSGSDEVAKEAIAQFEEWDREEREGVWGSRLAEKGRAAPPDAATLEEAEKKVNQAWAIVSGGGMISAAQRLFMEALDLTMPKTELHDRALAGLEVIRTRYSGLRGENPLPSPRW